MKSIKIRNLLEQVILDWMIVFLLLILMALLVTYLYLLLGKNSTFFLNQTNELYITEIGRYLRKSEESNPSNFDDLLIIRPDLETTVVNSDSPVTCNT